MLRDPTDDERLRLIIEAVPSAMVLVNACGRIVLVNSEAERAFGYTREELLALGVEDLMPERFRERHGHERTTYAARPDRRAMGVGRELFGLRSDGTEMPIEIGLNPITVGEGRYVLASIIDITERLRGQEALVVAREDALRRSILDTMPFSIIATDASGRIRTANPAAADLVGRAQDELIGRSLVQIDGSQRQLYPDGTPVLAHALGDEAEWTYRRKDGSTVPVHEWIVPLAPQDGAPGGFLVVAYDITQRIEARERIEHIVTHDSLTNLPNRSLLVRHLDQALERAERDATELALVLIDLDQFKRINDSLGHHIGDELLIVVAERLLAWTRSDDLVSRLGGDEFVIVLEDLVPGTDLDRRLEDLMTDVLAPVVVHGYELAVTASVGGTRCPADGRDAATLLKNVDIAMYQAKAAGRNEIRWYQPAMLEENNDRLALSAALRQALEQDELSLVYQPQVDLLSGEVVGVEALARWTSPTLGPVPPDRFIPVAEDGGMIAQLGGWVLATACTALAGVQDQIGRPLRLAVNVSPRQLRGRAWLDEIAAAIDLAGIQPSQLEVEITEGLLIEDHGDVVAMLESLRSLGVSIVVDDFGRGYSSLAYLTRFPIDKLKIDRSFVQEISTAENAAIVDAIIVMAHALGMTVVAEGVETPAQEQYLRERGCDEVQGYLYSPGVPAGSLEMVTRALSRQ
ncbi:MULTISPECIES: bifunctional diguanylate cyclase/phosphodiesterase [unclassified Nocardioides]|uniref:putative bifunctional diguanylate cyclase/phosphodiesterase n=1 Tax=unclassified Nocardioides TaxID=2615069 RepID=UPI00116EEA1B|nr:MULTISPECIES: EAL domain-containing protein [unclassified Nocardioides]TQK71682.1 PAS domain S-box-containing protein/diguanylate cyclase (GGDEF)-like protein [Nocardioides sp. SLBN-35]WGY04141.1 EAL domain-containing protein [Nocardioides sp. QY071]